MKKYQQGFQIRIEAVHYIVPPPRKKGESPSAHYSVFFHYQQIPARTQKEADKIVEAIQKAAENVRRRRPIPRKVE